MPFPDADRTLDVLDLDLAGINEADVYSAPQVVVDHRSHADAPRLGQRLQSCGYVDPITVDVVAIDDDVTEVDADAERDGVGPMRHHSGSHRV